MIYDSDDQDGPELVIKLTGIRNLYLNLKKTIANKGVYKLTTRFAKEFLGWSLLQFIFVILYSEIQVE
jgi:hypothetical protein